MSARSLDTHPLRGLLATLAPAAVLPLGHFTDAPWAGEDAVGVVVLAAHLVAVGLLYAGVGVLPDRPRAGRALATAGIALVAGLCVAAVPRDPALGFTILLFAAGLLGVVWPAASEGARPSRRVGDVAPHARAAARIAAWGALPAWVLAVPGEWASSPVSAAGAVLSLLVAGGFAARWAWIARRLGAPRTPLALAGVGLTGAGALLAPLVPVTGLALMGAGPPLTLLATRCAPAPDARGAALTPLEALLSHPARALVATFLAICLGGALALSLPAAATRHVSLVDALFTAVSATCVTGLAVLDTPNDLTRFGQAILLLLIQVGGLGILTFSTAAFALLGRRMSVRHEGAVADVVGAETAGDLFHTVRDVLRVTFVAEGLGAVLLTGLFLLHGDSAPTALWRGVFTAVSAFCNAGFALQSTNLVPYRSEPGVLYVIAALITAGGFAPTLILAIPTFARTGRLALQHRLALAASVILVFVPAAGLAAFEWNGALAGLSVADRLHNALFGSVTLRTAGFNTVDMEAFGPASRTLMIACMFVGGSPGSTAGGIKTTTAALLTLAVGAAIRGHDQAAAFGRRIDHASIYKAAAVVTVGIGVAGAVLLALQLTQALPFDVLLFETVSALGTVGLSLNATPRLDDVGRIVVALAMFAGRVGPLTLFLLLSEREHHVGPRLPEEPVAVG